jgi:hypothetical protein
MSYHPGILPVVHPEFQCVLATMGLESAAAPAQ